MMKHIYILLLLLLGRLSAISAQGLEPEEAGHEEEPTVELSPEYLYYCNAGDDVAKIWPLPNGYAFGARRKDINSPAIRDIVLIDPNGLFADSLDIRKSLGIERGFTGINSVSKVFLLGDDSYLLATQLNIHCLAVAVRDGQIVLEPGSDENLNLYALALPGDLKTTKQGFWGQFTGRVGKTIIGYKRDQVYKDGISKNDVKNFPEFWVAPINGNKIGSPVTINSKEPVITEDLFLPSGRDWLEIPTRTDMYHRYYTYAAGVLYFNVTRANKCYMYDTRSGQVSMFSFPPVGKGQSCFYFNDAWDGSHWFAKKEKKGEYGIYRISEGFKGYRKAGTVPLLPKGIYGGKVLVSKQSREKGKDTVCHYLLPTALSPAQKTQIIDHGVTVD